MKTLFKSLGFIIILLMVIAGVRIYNAFEAPSIRVNNGSSTFLYIKTGSSFQDVLKELENQKLIQDKPGFIRTATIMKYKENIRPGRYQITDRMSNRQLVKLLRSGSQTPVKFTFNNLRTTGQLIAEMAAEFEPDSSSISSALFDSIILDSLGLDSISAGVIFIPNTYDIFWNITSANLIKRMVKEYNTFWSAERREKAKKLNLTLKQVSILASIVEQETQKKDEKPVIAGVYLNRLNKGWRLEADPTLVYASDNFSINRVLNIHKEIDSPFNTYKNFGLPPGPICLPSISSIDAVLNADGHDYMYFCARDDMSGYHVFASNYAEHQLNARRFQQALNRRGIRK
ncbi:MAG: endolytic transglycosylase MltG [Bacteroidia bacterium]|nr:endolytic transglycosylase MltG [Bacteroidia bacterium]MCZ2277583.1 endolytic transglycosylase MltG [Bacteroidia bacterium]